MLLLIGGLFIHLSMHFQLVWLIPDNNHELLWDYGMCADTSRGAAVRDLIAKAAKGPLVPAQQEVRVYLSNTISNKNWETTSFLRGD